MIKNNCLDYCHRAGSPWPETAGSCRGCTHSADPELHDAGCTLHRRKTTKRGSGRPLTASESRKVDGILRKVNEDRKRGLPAGIEYR